MDKVNSNDENCGKKECLYFGCHVKVSEDLYDLHLLHCRKLYNGEFKQCRFSVRHLVPLPELAFHEASCPNREGFSKAQKVVRKSPENNHVSPPSTTLSESTDRNIAPVDTNRRNYGQSPAVDENLGQSAPVDENRRNLDRSSPVDISRNQSPTQTMIGWTEKRHLRKTSSSDSAVDSLSVGESESSLTLSDDYNVIPPSLSPKMFQELEKLVEIGRSKVVPQVERKQSEYMSDPTRFPIQVIANRTKSTVPGVGDKSVAPNPILRTRGRGRTRTRNKDILRPGGAF